MTAKATLLHCGLVGVVGVSMCDFALGVTEQVEDMDCASPLCDLSRPLILDLCVASTSTSIGFHLHSLNLSDIHLECSLRPTRNRFGLPEARSPVPNAENAANFCIVRRCEGV
jgi:hypothetical protein